MCVSDSSAVLHSAARFTDLYITLVGQEAAPKKCVLLSTSGKVRSEMKNWSVSDAGCLGSWWTIEHFLKGQGCYSCLWGFCVFLMVSSVAALPLVFPRMVRHVPAALHGAEASLVSQDALRKLHTAFVASFLIGGLASCQSRFGSSPFGWACWL